MKRYAALLLSLVLAVSLTGCAAPSEKDPVTGTIRFYSEPTLEFTAPLSQTSVELSPEQGKALRAAIDGVDEWIDDHAANCLAYYFDGEFALSDSEAVYCFSYEHNVIYYDHYFAQITAEQLRAIQDIAAEHGIEAVRYEERVTGTFSYREALEMYQENDPGVFYGGFRNASELAVTNSHEALERAKNECTVEYNETHIFYDEATGMWQILFSTEGMLGGCQTVYLDGKGITRLIVYGE